MTLLQFLLSRRVSRVVQRRLSENPDEAIAWLKQQLTTPIDAVAPVAIVLNCLEVVGVQQFLKTLVQVNYDESLSVDPACGRTETSSGTR